MPEGIGYGPKQMPQQETKQETAITRKLKLQENKKRPLDVINQGLQDLDELGDPELRKQLAPALIRAQVMAERDGSK